MGKLNQRSYRITAIASLLFFAATCIIPMSVRANPMAINYNPFYELSLWILIMLAANIPLNLFWYSLSLLSLTRRMGEEVGDLPKKPRTFLALLLYAVFIISLAGIVFDFIFILNGAYGYQSNVLIIAVGVLLIFLSIYMTSRIVLRLKKWPSLLAGSVLAAMNPVYWYTIRFIFTSMDWIIALPVIFSVLAITSVLFLMRKRMGLPIEAPADDSDTIPRHETYHWQRAKRDMIISIIILSLIALPIVIEAISPTPQYHPYSGAYFAANEYSTEATTEWVITSISSGSSVLRSDVFVQVKDANSVIRIATIELALASGTCGFNYTPASAGNFIVVGDEFSLDRALYSNGSTITLVNEVASFQYCRLTV